MFLFLCHTKYIVIATEPVVLHDTLTTAFNKFLLFYMQKARSKDQSVREIPRRTQQPRNTAPVSVEVIHERKSVILKVV
ncbi:MAG TPA: hypothetical protein DEO71_01120 [Chryseobacterium sp.]|nr:hypothetical protein [Chryseobacterium sp.]